MTRTRCWFDKTNGVEPVQRLLCSALAVYSAMPCLRVGGLGVEGQPISGRRAVHNRTAGWPPWGIPAGVERVVMDNPPDGILGALVRFR